MYEWWSCSNCTRAVVTVHSNPHMCDIAIDSKADTLRLDKERHEHGKLSKGEGVLEDLLFGCDRSGLVAHRHTPLSHRAARIQNENAQRICRKPPGVVQPRYP